MEKCPACEREFESIHDYPRIYVRDFKRLELPEIIEGRGDYSFLIEKETDGSRLRRKGVLPENVRKGFEDSERKILTYEGMVYRKVHFDQQENIWMYSAREDVTGLVNEVVSRQQVQDALNSLESQVGKEVVVGDLSKNFPSGMSAGDYNDFGLSFVEGHNLRKNGSAVSISLLAGCDVGTLTSWEIGQNLANLYYEGRINKI